LTSVFQNAVYILNVSVRPITPPTGPTVGAVWEGGLVVATTHLVPIPPEEFLGPDVLVWVLDFLLERGLVRLVLPVLVPEAPGVDCGHAEAGDDDAEGGVLAMSVGCV